MLPSLLSALTYPSLSGIEPSREFSIVAPADNAVINVPPNGTTDLSLRYVVRGFSGRLCLTLTHGQLQYYRGPLIHRDASLLKQYAQGCFSAGQPITLQGLGTGMYSLAAALRDGSDAVSMTHAPIFFAVVEQRADAFEPTYEWQEVEPGQTVPSGLDVRLSLDGTHKTLARILPSWQLQLYTPGLGFVRLEVTRHSRLHEIEEAAVAMARSRGGGPGCTAALWSAAEPLPPTLTAEEAQLFSRRASLKLQLEGCGELKPKATKPKTIAAKLEARRGARAESQPPPPASSALVAVET